MCCCVVCVCVCVWMGGVYKDQKGSRHTNFSCLAHSFFYASGLRLYVHFTPAMHGAVYNEVKYYPRVLMLVVVEVCINRGLHSVSVCQVHCRVLRRHGDPGLVQQVKESPFKTPTVCNADS